MEAAPTRVVVTGVPVGVIDCKRHPSYRAFEAAHDLGVCRLNAPASIAAIPIYTGQALPSGKAVRLAGYGKSSVLAKDSGVLRAVDTTVGHVHADRIDVGSADHTACQGDSGGPVLVMDGGSASVVGVIHGASREMCASPAEATPVRVEDAWLLAAIGVGAPASERPDTASVIVLALAAVVAVGLMLRSWMRRRGSPR